MAKPWILPGRIGSVYWVAPAASVITGRAVEPGFHQAKLPPNCRLGWACQNNAVPDGSAIAIVTAAAASQARAGCRLAQAAIRRAGGSRRAGPRLCPDAGPDAASAT